LTIVTGSQETASNTDILQGTRLQSIPSNGLLTFEMQAADNVAANNYTVTIQLPGGDTPLNEVRVPGGLSAGLAGIIDDRVNMSASFVVTQGGHCVFSCVETGDTEFDHRVTFTPF